MKCRLIKLPVIIYPATDNWIEHASQVFKRLVGHSMQPPASDGIVYGFGRFIAHCWQKAYKEFSIPGFRPSGSKSIPQKIEFLVWIVPFPECVLTISDLGLIRM